MKSFKVMFIVVALAASLLTGDMVYADRSSGGGGGKGGYSKGGGHRGGYYKGGKGYYGRSYRGRGYYRGYYGSGFNVWVGGPWWYYPYYYPYYSPYSPYAYPYYSPTVISVPTEPQQYIERSQRDGSSAPAAIWYFCPDSKTYYPYVKQCPGGWQTVPAQPPPTDPQK